MAKAARTRKPASTSAARKQGRLMPPAGGAVVRMYRIGHGDCFLVAFSGQDAAKPSYVLLDCGYKPNSPQKLDVPTTATEVGRDILKATGGYVDVAVVTHEHQDHVNGLTSENFPNLAVGEVWLAWTENPRDEVANLLRKKFGDRLLTLIDKRAGLLGLGLDEAAYNLDYLLETELGEAAGGFNGRDHSIAAGKDPAKSANKRAMSFLCGCAPGEPEYLYPHAEPRPIPGAEGARAFVLGPPRDIDKIDDLDPHGEEEFRLRAAPAAGAGTGGPPSSGPVVRPPFSRRHVIPLDDVMADPDYGSFFREHYGDDASACPAAASGDKVPDDASWRRLTFDDVAASDALALAMNNATNNSSLVLAFELSKGGKVLLFVGDAQAGNWRSWSDETFNDDGTAVSAKDLLGRTVLYKVGHHGSHNATLNGGKASERASLAWMGSGRFASEFVAMITAVEKWAHQKPHPDWNHPLPAIKQALASKAGGRVLQTDKAVAQANGDDPAGWRAFMGRVSETPLYFDLRIEV